MLSFLNTDADTKSISFPRTVALDGVPTTLMVVQNIPVFEQTQSAPAAGASQGLATLLPNYEKKVNGVILNEVGVKLIVTPRIAGPTNVLLQLAPEISQKDALVASETLNGQVNTAPYFRPARDYDGGFDAHRIYTGHWVDWTRIRSRRITRKCRSWAICPVWGRYLEATANRTRRIEF